MQNKPPKIAFTGNSFGSKMDRIKPEKVPRQRVQKLWRSVRWASEFPEESISLDPGEITPTFALRKVALLFENKKYSDCAALIRRLNCVTLSNILHEVPIDVLHDSLPQSLVILEALYVKLYETTESPNHFPKEELQGDQFLLKLVSMFAAQAGLNNKYEKNTNSVYPSCRNILRVILWLEPTVKQKIKSRKRALDKCVQHLGCHGLVASSEGTLMNLHDAFKIELENVIHQYRSALQKLEELNMSSKHPTGSSITFGPAPSSSSHHRMMQLTRDDIQDRIIKNRTLYNLCDPAISNQYLQKFVHILEKRIEYDKIVLFHDTELRKISKKQTGDTNFLATSLRSFSEGYQSVLQLLREVCEEDAVTEEEPEDDVFNSDEETVSPLMYRDKLRYLSGLNSVLHQKYTGGTRPSIIPINQTFRHGSINGSINGQTHRQLAQMLHNGNLYNRNGGKMMSLGEDSPHDTDKLQVQLEKARETIEHLQAREQQYIHQISQLKDNLPMDKTEGEATELGRRYKQLYEVHRAHAMESLDALVELKDVHSLKGKILFSIVVLSFRSVQQSVYELRGKLRHMLNLPSTPDKGDTISVAMERNIEEYLCKSVHKFDVSKCVQEVVSQILATLYDYPCLKKCDGLNVYINACVQLAWELSVQRPPYIIVYDSRVFNPEIHTRTDTCDQQNVMIQNFLWPALLKGDKGPCAEKGIVET